MSCHPKLYVRYIDDVFAVFDDVNACSSFLNILNSQHDNIKFTIEKSTNTLQFLDVDIKISENTVDTWVWRKPTNSRAAKTAISAKSFTSWIKCQTFIKWCSWCTNRYTNRCQKLGVGESLQNPPQSLHLASSSGKILKSIFNQFQRSLEFLFDLLRHYKGYCR